MSFNLFLSNFSFKKTFFLAFLHLNEYPPLMQVETINSVQNLSRLNAVSKSPKLHTGITVQLEHCTHNQRASLSKEGRFHRCALLFLILLTSTQAVNSIYLFLNHFSDQAALMKGQEYLESQLLHIQKYLTGSKTTHWVIQVCALALPAHN